MTMNYKNKGFTLIEVLVALAILSFGMLSLFSLIGSNLRAVETGKRQTQAINLASEKLEALKAIAYNNLESTMAAADAGSGNIARTCTPAFFTEPTDLTITCIPSPATVSMGNLTYDWKWTVTLIDLDNDGDWLNDSGIPDGGDLKRIDLSVSWIDIMGSHTSTLTQLRGV